MSFKEAVIKELKKKVKEEIKLEVPPDPEMGDYAFPCFSLAKVLKQSPVLIAEDIAKSMKKSGMIGDLRANGPYVNFFVDKDELARQAITEIQKGFKIKKANKKFLIEYPGPNTNKPLHLGHVRNMILGSSLVNLFSEKGNNVIPVNINNDRGVHICKSMLAYKKWGKNDSPEKSKLKPDHFIGKYYVLFAKKANEKLEREAQEMVRKWEAGDKETLALWNKMNRWAFEGFKETYKTFDVKFKKEYYESKTYKKGKKIILDAYKKGLFKKGEEGEIYADLEDKGYGKKVLLRSDGTSVYITQDLYLAKARYDDFKFDKLIYVVGNEQKYHFNVLFELLKQLKYTFADKCYHFAYGMVNLTTGKMKSRQGTVVDADNIAEDMIELAKKETKKRHKGLTEKELNKRAKQLGMGALKFHLLKYDAEKDITFDPRKSIEFEGDTGPYVQYAHARICSILRKYGKKLTKKVDFKLLNDAEKDLAKTLSKYQETVAKSAEDYNPSILCHYLVNLSHEFSSYYVNNPILDQAVKLRDLRLLLADSVRTILKQGLGLLGIEAPERM